ncbi:MAG: helix-turn-helix domain-containing protein [Desulfobacteraceae bacterium]|jgi:transcriptional regulator with XRE-family HTH domain|nr:helix-turn-helix domain-containing protein [Desulfobacteraceae bacterium]
MTNTKAKKKKRGPKIDPEEFSKEADSLEIPDEILETYPMEERSILRTLFGVTAAAAKFISKSTWASEKVGEALFSSPERLKMMQEAGAYLRDLRQVAGLTRRDVSNAVNLSDESFLTAVENGTATLSFELILRLAALLARHDPIPFIIKFIRTYNPGVWGVLEDWGLEKFPLQFERERQFINIYRSHDDARKLSDEGFQRVLEFTRTAFEMALHFVAEENKQEK